MSILYNLTIKIDHQTHDEWLKWIKSVHIPKVLATDLFESNRFCRLLNQDESDGLTYSLQYVCKDMKTLQQYSAKHAPAIDQEHMDKFKGKYVVFRTLLEIIE